MFCPKCGKDIKDGSKFCKYCGSEIKNKSSPSASVANTSSNDDEKTKKIIIGALIVVIVVLVVVFATFSMGLLNGDSQNANVQQGNVQQGSAQSGAGSKPVSLNSFPVSESPALAQAIKNSNGNFPVQFQSLSLSKAQCLYILSKSIVEINNGNTDGSISVGNPGYAPHPSGRDSSQSIARSNYVDMSNRFSSWIDRNGEVPNYVGIYTGGAADVSPSKMLDICVHILINYGSSHNLPASVNI